MSSKTDTKAVTLKIVGNVQGVTFRYSAIQQSQLCSVTGWIRNEPDGSVAVHVEGASSDVDRFVAWCHKGPQGASVRDVIIADAIPKGFKEFVVSR